MTIHFCRTHNVSFTDMHCPVCESDARARHASDEATSYTPFVMPDFSSSYDYGSSSSSSDYSSPPDTSSSTDFGGGGGFSGGGGGTDF